MDLEILIYQMFYNATGKQSYLNELKSKNMDINKVIESNLKTHYANLRTTEEAQINILKAVSQEIEKVKDNVVLPDVMNSFYDWHKQKGYKSFFQAIKVFVKVVTL